jgi:Flp pilus assembly protein TadD
MKKFLFGGLIFLLMAGAALAAEQWKVKLEEAKVYLDQSQYQKAESILATLAKDHSDSLEVDYYLGICQMAQGKYADAEKALRAAAKVKPDDTLVCLDLAYVLVAQNQPGEASQLADKVLAKQPDNGRANYLKGLTLVQQGKCKDADAYFVKAKGQAPQFNAEISYYQGVCAKSGKDNKQANKYFNEAISAGKGTIWATKASEEKLNLLAGSAGGTPAARNKFFAKGDLFYQYDSNIVAVPDKNYLPSDISNLADSRTVVWLQAGYRPIMSSKGELGLEYHFYNSWHWNESDMDLMIHQGQAYGLYNFNVGNMPARIYATYLYQWDGLGTKHGYYSQLNRFNPIFYLAETKNLVTEIGYYFENDAYDEPGTGQFDRNYNANQVMAGEHFLFDAGKFDIGLYGRYENDDANGNYFTSNNYGGRLTAQMKDWNKLSGWAYFDYDYRDFQGIDNKAAYCATHAGSTSSYDILACGPDREDKVTQIGVEVQYQIVKYLSVFAGFNYSDHNSTAKPFDYDREIYTVGVRGVY